MKLNENKQQLGTVGGIPMANALILNQLNCQGAFAHATSCRRERKKNPLISHVKWKMLDSLPPTTTSLYSVMICVLACFRLSLQSKRASGNENAMSERHIDSNLLTSRKAQTSRNEKKKTALTLLFFSRKNEKKNDGSTHIIASKETIRSKAPPHALTFTAVRW